MHGLELPAVMKTYIDNFIEEIIEVNPSRFGGVFRFRFREDELHNYFDEHADDDLDDNDILVYINNYMTKYGRTTKQHIANATGISY